MESLGDLSRTRLLAGGRTPLLRLDLYLIVCHNRFIVFNEIFDR